MNPIDSKANELFFVVDEHDHPLAPLPRRLVHGYGVWHRVSHIWVLNGQGGVLCQQRSLDKELNPGMWESFFGGHLRPDESYIEAARRELAEEIHLAPTNLVHELTYKYFDTNGYNNEFQGIFSAVWYGDLSELSFDDGEVAQVKWIPLTEVLARIDANDPPWTNCGYELNLLTTLVEQYENNS